MNPHSMTMATAVRRTALALALLLAAIFSITAQEKTQCNVKVTLLQVNDVYQFLPVDRGNAGGLARVLTKKKEIQKEENANTLFLMAGDTISPSVESIELFGAQMIDAWNAVGLDYATFGNHEFDFGPDKLRDRIKESKFGWIAANVIDVKTGRTFADVPPYVIREFNGVKVGIFGLVLPETKTTSKPGPDIVFRNPCETAKQMVSELHAQGAKVVVALTHLSMREDKEVARCADVDVIIGGHEHSLLESHAGNAPIFKMTSDARELGQIDLNISQTTGELESIDWKVIKIDKSITGDPEFAAVERKYATLLSKLSKPVGTSKVNLNAKSAENRTQETNVGNLVADSFRKTLVADVGLMNGGSIRADALIPAGRIAVRDVLSILPFGNRLVKIEVTGATLKAALEHGVSRTAPGAEPGGFPQVSGIQFSFDATKDPGSRVTEVKVNGQPLNETRKYTVATSEFLAGGGDGYEMLKGSPVLDRAPSDSDALKRMFAGGKPIAPKVEGRIKRLDTAQKGSDCN